MMKLRQIISISLLVVYGIVISHDIMPHHHHYQVSDAHEHQHCHGHDADHEHTGAAEGDYSQSPVQHIHCSLEDLTIPGKKINPPVAQLLANLQENVFILDNVILITETYLVPNYIEHHCRDVLLRGPPLIS